MMPMARAKVRFGYRSPRPRQSEASSGAGWRLALKQSLAETRRIRPGFIKLPDPVMSPYPLLQIGVNRISMLQIVANRRVNFGKSQRWVLLKYFFGSRSLIEGVDHRVEPNAAAADSHYPIFIRNQRGRIT